MSNGVVTTPVGRVSFPSVFTPYTNDQGKQVYEITLILDRDADLSALKKIVAEAAAEKWGRTSRSGQI